MDNNEVIKKIAEHDVLIKKNAEEIESLDKRVDSIHRIVTSVELIAQDMKHIKTDISEVKTDQKELKREVTEIKSAEDQRKARFMDDLKSKLLWLFIGGIATGILALLLPQFFK